MAFLRRLSDEEKSIKLLKQERFKQDLLIQCQEKEELKQSLKLKKKAEDQHQYQLEMAARGLEAQQPTKGRGRVRSTNQITSPARENKSKNNSTIFTPTTTTQRTSFGRPRPFLSTLNELHGTPLANHESQKKRARDKLRSELAEQVREREEKKAMAEYQEKVREAREMQINIDKGYDFWGYPLQPGATPLKLPDRLRPFLDPANAPSPSAPPAIFSAPRVLHEEEEYGQQPAYDEEEDHNDNYNENETIERMEGRTNNNNNNNNNNNSQQLQELTALCRQLVEEQKLLRQTVDKQAEQIASRRSPRRTTSTRPPRRQRSQPLQQKREKGSSNRNRGMTKSKSSGGAAFGSTSVRMVAEEGLSYKKERRGRHRRGNSNNEKGNNKGRQTHIRAMAPTKQEKEEARKRRIATRAEYAKSTRFRSKGIRTESISPTRRPRKQQQQQQQQQQQRVQPPAWEDNRPIRPLAKLDGDSQFVTGYDRKRNPLASLASGNTPRREDLNTFVAKKFVPPQEHFTFDQ